jgi:N-formylglutamate amidohydrolase
VSKLIVHVPHASVAIPSDTWTEFLVSRSEVEAEALASSDQYTDEIARQAWPDAQIIEAKVSRIVLDVERYEDDGKEEMAEVGRGVFYTHDHQRKLIRKSLDQTRRDQLLEQYYRPHWQNLRAHAAGAILIDLHTYPAVPWPIERHAAGPRPEIDIGFTNGLTPPAWTAMLSTHFKAHGYEVALNSPYAGVIAAGASAAVMIEVRRDLVGKPGADQRWQRLISALSTMPIEV